MLRLAHIALGSNLGDRKANLDGAIKALATRPGITLKAVSRYMETAPVGVDEQQGPYLNAAASLETSLDPFEMHRLLLEIETLFGRVRGERWAARTLDLDLLLFGDQVITTEVLTVPHPRMHMRRFVLEPLSEIAPNAVDPRGGKTITQLLDDLCHMPRE
jgi:2-amino-4-hydroxy-6-hydroxymethyldihydropteridine diphosphokinase